MSTPHGAILIVLALRAAIIFGEAVAVYFVLNWLFNALGGAMQ